MSRRRLCAILLLACCAALASGCASDGTGGSVHGSVYYGVGWHDPYYYGGGYGGDVVVVPNPPDRPDRPGHSTQTHAPASHGRPVEAFDPRDAAPIRVARSPLTFCLCCDRLCDWSGSGRADSTCVAAAECEMQIDTLDEALGLHAYQLRA